MGAAGLDEKRSQTLNVALPTSLLVFDNTHHLHLSRVALGIGRSKHERAFQNRWHRLHCLCLSELCHSESALLFVWFKLLRHREWGKGPFGREFSRREDFIRVIDNAHLAHLLGKIISAIRCWAPFILLLHFVSLERVSRLRRLVSSLSVSHWKVVRI